MRYVIILATFAFTDSVFGYYLTTCNSQNNTIEKESLNKTEDISPPILYHDVESILRVLGTPQNKFVTGVREILQYYEESRKRKAQFETSGNVKKYPLIVLEGLSGTGKTTLAMNLLNKINCTPYHSPPEHIYHLRDLFKHNIVLDTAFTFLGQYIASYDVQLKLTHSPVIMDRYWHSSAAFSIAYAVNNFPEKYLMPPREDRIYTWPKDLLKPDIVFLLEVDETIRDLRMKKRNNLTKEAPGNLDNFLSRCPRFLKNLSSAYKNMNNPEVVVINANVTADEVLEDVYSKIKKMVTI